MKKLIFQFILFLFSVPLFSQEKVLTFNAFGAASTIESIKATNMVSGKSITVTGTNKIELNSITTGLNEIERNYENASVYPNPFNAQTTLQFNVVRKENIKILLVNSMGQVVAITRQDVVPGVHKFLISSKSLGVNHVVILSGDGSRSCKMVSLNDRENLNSIEYIGFAEVKGIEKSLEIEKGELIHFEISSGIYTTVVADSPTDSKTYDVELMKCQDDDGKNYKVVKIGTQWWMSENLAYLPEVASPVDGSYTEPYYYVYDYKGTSANEAKASDKYKTNGVLYNWNAANAACPDGWHLPTDTEWEKLAEFINSDNDGAYINETAHEYEGWWSEMGKHLKSNNGWSQNGTDDYGFTGIPCGFRAHSGVFGREDSHVYWWSATEYYNSAWSRKLEGSSSNLFHIRHDKNEGFSVRCIKD